MRQQHCSKSCDRSENRPPIPLKSGVSKEVVNEIKEQIPGIKAGFDTEAKPWTSDEQKNAIKDYHEKIRKTTL